MHANSTATWLLSRIAGVGPIRFKPARVSCWGLLAYALGLFTVHFPNSTSQKDCTSNRALIAGLMTSFQLHADLLSTDQRRSSSHGPLGIWPTIGKLAQLLKSAASTLIEEPACQTHLRQSGGLASLISSLAFLQQLQTSCSLVRCTDSWQVIAMKSHMPQSETDTMSLVLRLALSRSPAAGGNLDWLGHVQNYLQQDKEITYE